MGKQLLSSYCCWFFFSHYPTPWDTFRLAQNKAVMGHVGRPPPPAHRLNAPSMSRQWQVCVCVCVRACVCARFHYFAENDRAKDGKFLFRCIQETASNINTSTYCKISFLRQRGQLRLLACSYCDTILRPASPAAPPCSLLNFILFLLFFSPIIPLPRESSTLCLGLSSYGGKEKEVLLQIIAISNAGKAPYGYCCVSTVASTRGTRLPLRAICRTAMWI